MPDPWEISCVGVAGPGCRAIESDRGATGTARNSRGERYIFQSVNGANIKNVLPGQAAVIRCRNSRGGAISSTQQIHTAIVIDANCWITANPCASWIIDRRRTNTPGYSVVLGDDHRLHITAVRFRNVDNSGSTIPTRGRERLRGLRSYFHVTVQTATCSQVVNHYRSTVGQPAVIASRARRKGDVLR